MAQHDFVIDDQNGLSFLADLNDVLAAIVSNNSGATEPTETYAYQWWADTSSGILKMRNAADNAWVSVFNLATGIPVDAELSALAGLTSAANKVPMFSGPGTATLLDFKDEDDMVSDSATAVPSQQSVKAYVDANAGILRNYIDGLILSTAGSSSTMSISAGSASDSTNVVLITLASTISKTTSAWAVGSTNGGLDTGTIANNTWYYFFAIRRPDTGVVDVVFSTNTSAPTLPTNYTQYRYIGAGFTNGSGQWTKFLQVGDEFIWDAPSLDASGITWPTASRTLYGLTVPKRRVKASVNIVFGTVSATENIYVSCPELADLAPSVTAAPLSTSRALSFGGGTGIFAVNFSQWTNTNGQIGIRSISGTNGGYIACVGWTDPRGKD